MATRRVIEPPPVPVYFNLESIHLSRKFVVAELKYCQNVDHYRLDLLKPRPLDDVFVGFDPGQRNAGLAVLTDGRRMDIYQITWADMSSHAEEAHYAMSVVKYLVDQVSCYMLYGNPGKAVVENSAHSKGMGQQRLAENRTAAMIGLYDMRFKVEMAAPNSITAKILKSGRRRAKDEWGLYLGPDGAAAAAACLLAAGFDK